MSEIPLCVVCQKPLNFLIEKVAWPDKSPVYKRFTPGDPGFSKADVESMLVRLKICLKADQQHVDYYLKTENTVLINLQNKKSFKKLEDGRFAIV